MIGSISQIVIFSMLGISRERARGNSRAESDSQHRSRLRMQQRRQMADHALQPHVVGLGGGLYVAVDVYLHGAIVPLRDGDRGISAFGRVEDLAICPLRLPCGGRKRSIRRGWRSSTQAARRPPGSRQAERDRLRPALMGIRRQHEKPADGRKHQQHALRSAASRSRESAQGSR